MERFVRWLRLKQALHQQKHKPPLISEGDIWWASIGENIGREIHGKSERFSRPVIVYKKLSRETFLAIPTSTKITTGTWYVPFEEKGRPIVACLNQIRVIDYRRLSSKIETLSTEDFCRIQDGFKKLYI
jgi:mRNA-degrading endonuclease toxin of MazEF toxin-antitoxin module